MLGDFNLNVIDKNSDDARHVKWIEQATGLKQCIDGITRYSNNNSCIDLLFTNMVNNFSVNILDLNISDHQFIHINRAHVPKKVNCNLLVVHTKIMIKMSSKINYWPKTGMHCILITMSIKLGISCYLILCQL